MGVCCAHTRYFKRIPDSTFNRDCELASLWLPISPARGFVREDRRRISLLGFDISHLAFDVYSTALRARVYLKCAHSEGWVRVSSRGCGKWTRITRILPTASHVSQGARHRCPTLLPGRPAEAHARGRLGVFSFAAKRNRQQGAYQPTGRCFLFWRRHATDTSRMFLLLLPRAPTSACVVPCTPLTYLPDDPDLRCFARACSAAPLSPRLEKVHATLMRCGLNGPAARLKLRNCNLGVDEADWQWQRDRVRREVALTSLVAQAQRQADLKRPTALAIAPPPSSALAAASARPLIRRLPPPRLWDRVAPHRTRRSPPWLEHKIEVGDESANPPTPSPPSPSPSLWVMAKAATARARQRASDKDRSAAPLPLPLPRPAPRLAASPEAAERTIGRAAAPSARTREGALHRVRSFGPSSKRPPSSPSSASDARPALFGGLCVLAVGALVL